MDFLRKHWKAVGALVGGIVGLLVSVGVITPDQGSAITTAGMTLIGSLIGAYAAPANDV